MNLDSNYWIKKGFMDADEKPAFRTMVDAANCFGKVYKPKGIWSGAIKHYKEVGKELWFPKIGETQDWENSFSIDESFFYEKNRDLTKNNNHVNALKNSDLKRLIFLKLKNTGYFFKGEYKIDKEKTNYQNGCVWVRISKKANTYQ